LVTCCRKAKEGDDGFSVEEIPKGFGSGTYLLKAFRVRFCPNFTNI